MDSHLFCILSAKPRQSRGPARRLPRHPLLSVSNLPSLAFSSTVLATMFSSSIKNTESQMQRFLGTQSVRSGGEKKKKKKNTLRPSGGTAGFWISSLLVDVRADFTCIKVVKDKTGCHRLARGVSWTWFLLRAESPALHFYSNPSRTIPCVISGAKSLRYEKKKHTQKTTT